MREELDAKLVAKYPLIFKNRNGNMKETLMCWGFSCGDGWYNIIDVLCGLLSSQYEHAKERYENLVEWKDEHGRYPWDGGKPITDEDIAEAKAKMDEEEQRVPVAVQVKEKFGSLRFYVDRASDKHYNYITFAESMSYSTCEVCGKPGTYYPFGWHHVACDEHASEEDKENLKEYENESEKMDS
jgi:hypothetical protein